MHILPTGGTGFVGQHLVRARLDRGHRAAILGRDSSAAGPRLGARAAVVDACAGADAVYHVGALSAPWGRSADFFSINVGGTQRVIDGCQQHRVWRLIVVSSPSVLFNGRDQPLLTDAAPYPAR